MKDQLLTAESSIAQDLTKDGSSGLGLGILLIYLFIFQTISADSNFQPVAEWGSCMHFQVQSFNTAGLLQVVQKVHFIEQLITQRHVNDIIEVSEFYC